MTLSWWVTSVVAMGMALTATESKAADVRFDSAYTNLARDCRGVSGEGPEGQDVPRICSGPSPYLLRISYAAADMQIAVFRDKGFVLSLTGPGSCPHVYGPRVEWRLAGKKPFAVITRVYCRGQQHLLIRGLAGYEGLDQDLPADAAGANKRARDAADAWYCYRNSPDGILLRKSM